MSVKDDVYKATLLEYSKKKDYYLPFEETPQNKSGSPGIGDGEDKYKAEDRPDQGPGSLSTGTSGFTEISGEENNPSCGDEVRLVFRLAGGTENKESDPEKVVLETRHDSMGCAVCLASVNMLCELSKNKPVSEVMRMADLVAEIVDPKKKDTQTADTIKQLTGKEEVLASLAGIKKYPVRVTCARMAWDLARSLLGPKHAEQ